MFTFRYPSENYAHPAGFGVRLAAYLIDVIVITIIVKLPATRSLQFRINKLVGNFVFEVANFEEQVVL